uniref:Core shell protein Gag P30 domain-containing protein n=1 Tax=Melopsittacus undulatus TaxID=13146 RepID=A0A8V5GWR0_MELUD
MGQTKGKPSVSMGRESRMQLPEISLTDKRKIIRYCVEVWGGQKIRADNLYWPVFGSFEDWICQALNIYVNNKEPFSLEESEYAALWLGKDTTVHLFALKEKSQKGKKTKTKSEETPLSPPPYYSPIPNAPPLEENESGSESETEQAVSGVQTRSQTRRKEQEKLYPLREVAMGGPQPGVGYVAVPLNSGDVRGFKKEMGQLLEDPIGVSERLDQLWEQQHQQGPAADTKWPMQRPNWNNQDAGDRGHMSDLRSMIIQGIRESVPRGQNIGKALSDYQKKDETPTEWLERLRKNLQLYSVLDPTTAVGQALLKTQFVAKSWTDIRRKLEKIEDWQEKDLGELLREAQKVYVRREEEAQKKQARILVAAVREGQHPGPNSTVNHQRQEIPIRQGRPGGPRIKRPGKVGENQVECFYCHQFGHTKWNYQLSNKYPGVVLYRQRKYK